MKINLNGEDKELPGTTTIKQLIDDLGFQDRAVAVEVNRELIPRRLHDQTQLADGDRVELVTLVGGG